MLLTIQIVNYNSQDDLMVCLRSIAKSILELGSLQIIIINNDERSLKGLLDGFKVELIEKNTNMGFGRAHNLGLQRAKGKYILLLNPDMRLFPETIARMIEAFSLDDKIGIVGAFHFKEKGFSEEEHFGLRKTSLSIIRTKISRVRKHLEQSDVFETDWVSGGAMMIRRDLFWELGGFDEGYFMYFEDVDLCLRAKKKGWKVVVHPQAKVFHKSGQSFSDNRKKKEYYYQSQDYYLRKHFGFFRAWFIKILRLPFYIRNVWFKKNGNS